MTIGALVYGVVGIVNMSWPRTPGTPWYDNYIVLVSGAVVVGVGAVYMAVAKPHERGDAPAGDASDAREPSSVPASV